MYPDYKNRVMRYVDPEEERQYKAHLSEFGPKTGKSHPDDCEFCKAMGWPTFPGTNFEAECDKYEAEHPEEFE